MVEKIDEVLLYKEYLATRDTGVTLTALAAKFRTTRQRVYSIIKRIEGGDEVQLNRCLDATRYDCMWKYRYERRFMAIDEDRRDASVKQLRALIREMHKDGFGIRDIARRVCKDASTVLHHIES